MKNYLSIVLLVLGINVSQAQITNGLVLHYDFNGSTVDQSVNGNDGVNTNVIDTLNHIGASNAAGYFDGVTSNVELSSNSSVKPNLPITLAINLKADNLSTNTPIYESDFYYNNYAGFRITADASGKVFATIGAGTGSGPTNRRTFGTNETITEGVWHRITVIINDYDDMEIFIDCQATTGSYSGTGSTTMSYSSNEGYIGKGAGNSFYPDPNFFKGSIDEVALWSRVLSSAELTDVCNGALKIDNLSPSYFAMYPNPSNSNVTLQLPSDVDLINSSYMITDLTGRVVDNVNISNSTQIINVSDLSKGIYLVNVFSGNKIMESKQLVVD